MVSAVSETLLVLITTILFMRLAKFFWSLLYLYKMCYVLPGPRGYPLIGSALDFLDLNTENTLRTIMHYFSTYPKIFKFWMGPQVVIGVSTPENLEIILNHPHCLEKSSFYEVTRCLVGNGIFSAPINTWRKHRKIISPSFSGRSLISNVKNFNDQAKKLTEILKKNVGKKDVDIFSLLSACNVDILCETAMGVVRNAQTSDDHFGKWIGRAEEIFSIRMTNPWYYTDFMFYWTKKHEVLKKYVAAMKKFTNQLVIERKQYFDKKMKEVKKGILVEDDNGGQKILLDVLLQLKNEMKMTNEEVYDEVNTFFAAGPDTTACALSFCFMILGMYPDIQQKVYEEIIDVLGLDRDITPEDLPRLQYLDRVIKETLRLFPTAPILSRSPTANIDINDAVIPARSIILICPLFTQRNPKNWKDPLTFNPDRFSPTEISKHHPYSYLPFLLGPRGCVGVTLQFYGEEITYNIGTGKQHTHGKYVTVDKELCLLDSEKLLPKGESRYRFSIEVPLRVPGSFHIVHGGCVYHLKATIKRHIKDITVKKQIQVTRPIDLNSYIPALQIQFETSIDRNINYCGWSRGKIILNAEIDKRLFLIGEKIVVHIDIINSSSVSVKHVFGRIMKKITIHFTHPGPHEIFHWEVVKKGSKFPGVGKRGQLAYPLYVEIPKNLHVPHIKYSKLFKMSFQLQVIAKLSGFNTSMVLLFKIYIGHVPFEGNSKNRKSSMFEIDEDAISYISNY